MNGLSTLRLYLLRAMYVFIVVGLGLMIWPLLLNQPDNLEHMRGVVWSLLAGVSVLAAFGIRYPVQMLPVLLFEFVWKVIWLVAIGLPNRGSAAFTPAYQQTWMECLIGVLMLLVAIPWGYVWRNYVARPGESWRRAAPAETGSEV